MTPTDRPVIWWARRDFRLADNPALGAAVDEGSAVLPLFVSDPVLRRSAGQGRAAWLTAAVADLDRVLRDAGGPGLTVLEGRPEEVVPRLAAELGAATVHVSADFGPYGRRRDARVAAALAREGRELHATGSPYAVAPGTLASQTGTPFQVFSPFHRAWLARGVHGP
ncbi:MAG: deoxyribodipyrimidine photo-lyase, partial [Janthinobacterium lividum]